MVLSDAIPAAFERLRLRLGEPVSNPGCALKMEGVKGQATLELWVDDHQE